MQRKESLAGLAVELARSFHEVYGLGLPGIAELGEKRAIGMLDGVVAVVVDAGVAVTGEEARGGVHLIAVQQMSGEFLAATLHRREIQTLIAFMVRVLQGEAPEAAGAKRISTADIG